MPLDLRKEVLLLVPTLGLRINYLIECLESIRNLTAKPFVLVAFPKISRSNMVEIINRFPEFEYMEIEGRLPEVINKVAIDYSHITWMNWIGDDDLLMPNSLEITYKSVAGTHYVGVYGGCIYIDSSGKKLGKYMPPKFAHDLIGLIPAAIKLEGGLFRTKSLVESGPLKHYLKYAPDVELTLKLRKKGKWLQTPNYLSKFRLHKGSPTENSRSESVREAHMLQLEYTSGLEKIFSSLVYIPIKIFKIYLFRIINLRAINNV